ncbi:MAG: hypothetical protein Kow00124_22210 [Anaerolineae bacterium]
MPYRVQVHIQNDDPVVMDIENLPQPTDTFIMGTNPQRRDGKDVDYILREVNQVIYPMWRINFIQILPGEQEESVPTFIRE